MTDSNSADRPRRRRSRRALGVLAGVALMAGPVALAPAAQAQSTAGPDLISTIIQLVQQILGGLGHTLQTPLGEQAPNSSPRPCEPTGLAELLSCVVGPLQQNVDPGRQAKGKIKATRKHGRIASVRWVK
jgi:hypothetical protein